MNELGEFRHGFDEMTRDELSDPLRRLLTHLSLQLDLQYSVREQFLVGFGKLIKGEIDSDVHSSPVIRRSSLTIPIVLSNERELSVERNSDSCISRKLESGTIVESSHHCRS